MGPARARRTAGARRAPTRARPTTTPRRPPRSRQVCTRTRTTRPNTSTPTSLTRSGPPRRAPTTNASHTSAPPPFTSTPGSSGGCWLADDTADTYLISLSTRYRSRHTTCSLSVLIGHYSHPITVRSPRMIPSTQSHTTAVWSTTVVSLTMIYTILF